MKFQVAYDLSSKLFETAEERLTRGAIGIIAWPTSEYSDYSASSRDCVCLGAFEQVRVAAREIGETLSRA